MGNNPLIELKNRLIGRKGPSYVIGRVIAVSAESVTIETESGITSRVWGSAGLGSWVLTDKDRILGVIEPEGRTVYVP